MNPFFSVVIPLFNKGNYIEATLQSVLAQSFSDFEILVVNDGSTDGGPKKVREINDPRISLFHQKNKGVSVARNVGAEHAKGKYIALLDADDYWYPDHLENLHQLICQFPQAGLYCVKYEILLDGKTCREAVYSMEMPDNPHLVENYFKASLANPVAWTSAVAFPKSRFDEIGPFDTHLRTGQDIDFFIRSALKVPIAFSPKCTMRYHKHSENNLAKSHFNEDRVFLIEKHKAAEKDNPSLKKYLDYNRYAIAVRYKLLGNPAWKKLGEEINPGNLNAKQRFLLEMPAPILRLAIKFQRILMKWGIYWTAFR